MHLFNYHNCILYLSQLYLFNYQNCISYLSQLYLWKHNRVIQVLVLVYFKILLTNSTPCLSLNSRRTGTLSKKKTVPKKGWKWMKTLNTCYQLCWSKILLNNTLCLSLDGRTHIRARHCGEVAFWFCQIQIYAPQNLPNLNIWSTTKSQKWSKMSQLITDNQWPTKE